MQLVPRTSADTTRGIRLPAAPAETGQRAEPQAFVPAATATVASPVAPAVASPVRPAAAPRATTLPADVPAASITVTFPSGSAELTAEARAALTPLGQALSSRDLSRFRFRVEGHTDSVGSRDANQALSQQRAIAVRQFLIQSFAIDSTRIDTIGRGEDDLLVETGDEVPDRRNRRVQVVNLGD